MSLYKDPLEAIFKAAETQNKITLKRDQYVLGDPLVYVDPAGKTNTEIVMTARSPLSPYEGSAPLHYTRLDLASLATYLPSPILGHGIVTISDAIALLNKNYGLTFVTADLAPGNTNLTDDVGTVTLTALDKSLGWIGTVDLLFARGNISIDSVITTKSLPGMVYPNRDDSKPFGEMETYWRDFTDYTTVLDAQSPESFDLVALRDVLTAVTGKTWVSDAAGRYSISQAVVTYRGLTSGYPQSGQDRGYVCVIKLGPPSLGLSGNLILQYGLPPIGPD
jgi:hypothetical protein